MPHDDHELWCAISRVAALLELGDNTPAPSAPPPPPVAPAAAPSDPKAEKDRILREKYDKVLAQIQYKFYQQGAESVTEVNWEDRELMDKIKKIPHAELPQKATENTIKVSITALLEEVKNLRDIAANIHRIWEIRVYCKQQVYDTEKKIESSQHKLREHIHHMATDPKAYQQAESEYDNIVKLMDSLQAWKNNFEHADAGHIEGIKVTHSWWKLW